MPVGRSLGTASLVRQLGDWRAAANGSAYRALADALRLQILDGRLALDVRLPGERDLATALGLSRTTVAAAFALLREQGFLVSRQGSGSRTSIPRTAVQRTRPDDTSAAVAPAGTIDFVRASLPAGEAVHAAYATALAALPAYLPGHGYEPVGLPVLRRAVAERYTARGLPTAGEQVLVTHGAQHAFALVLRLLAGPGDRVVLDHPTYPHAIDAVQRASCRVVPVALPEEAGGDGWDADALVAALHQAGPRLAYLVPDFHNPTGRCMDARTRRVVAAAAARSGTVLVVDETMRDLWLDAPAPGPDLLHGSGATTITIGSTGKSFWGGLRVGWIRADAGTVAALAAVRTSLDLGTPVLEQLAVAALLVDDEAQLDARRAVLRARRDHLVAAVAEHLPDWRLAVPGGGLSLWATLPAPASTQLAARAASHGVALTAGPRFGLDGAFERAIRLPYTCPEADLSEAVRRIARAYGEIRQGTAVPEQGPSTLVAV